MVEAVVEFVRKKHPKFVHMVKILIFQTAMMPEFHKSMKLRGGGQLEEKSIFSKWKGIFFSGKLHPILDHFDHVMFVQMVIHQV